MKVKVKVFVNHRHIGWLRVIGAESVITTRMAAATTIEEQAVGMWMLALEKPERATSKALEPVVTFQLLHV